VAPKEAGQIQPKMMASKPWVHVTRGKERASVGAA
jgi:hypothetical protein